MAGSAVAGALLIVGGAAYGPVAARTGRKRRGRAVSGVA
jgi:signal peptidase I